MVAAGGVAGSQGGAKPVLRSSVVDRPVVADAAVGLSVLTWRTVKQVVAEQLASAQARARAQVQRLVRAARPRAAPRSAARRPAARRRTVGVALAGDERQAPWHRKVRSDKGTSCRKKASVYRPSFLSNLYLKIVSKSFLAPINLGL
jgi:hypothetical protein